MLVAKGSEIVNTTLKFHIFFTANDGSGHLAVHDFVDGKNVSRPPPPQPVRTDIVLAELDALVTLSQLYINQLYIHFQKFQQYLRCNKYEL